MDRELTIVGLGGTLRPHSSSERALDEALAATAALGARTVRLTAAELDLPMYDPTRSGDLGPRAEKLVRALADADGVVIATPGYHGGISGLLKNALDYTEELRSDVRPYLDGRAVGCIACAHGWQATVTTLAALRSVAHALRAWPTPLGVAINGTAPDPRATSAQLALMAGQVVEFARARRAPAVVVA